MKLFFGISLALASICLSSTAGCEDQTAPFDVEIDTTGVKEMVEGLFLDIEKGQTDFAYKNRFTLEFRVNRPRSSWDAYVANIELNGKFVSCELASSRTRMIEATAEGDFVFKVEWEKTQGMVKANMRKTDMGWRIISISEVAEEMKNDKFFKQKAREAFRKTNL